MPVNLLHLGQHMLENAYRDGYKAGFDAGMTEGKRLSMVEYETRNRAEELWTSNVNKPIRYALEAAQDRITTEGTP